MPTRRLAAIMFSDIVGYTGLMQRDETDGLAKVKLYKDQLEHLVKVHDGEILQHYGDGSLTIFSSAVEAARCAKALQENLHGKVPLKIGMHIGDIILENENIYGDGVNLASRIESLGQEGTVFFSKHIYDKIRNIPEFELTSLGTFVFKNVDEPLEVFALSNEGFQVPKKGQIKGKLQPSSSKVENRWLIAGLTVLIIALIGFWRFGPPNPPTPPQTPALSQAITVLPQLQENSVAVLPFKNLNRNKEGDFFSDGMMEDILMQLSKLKDLKVISRTSAMQYKNTDKKVPQIARELGVSHVLEGSVRTHGEQARITVTLIDALKDIQIWAETYDRSMEDLFEVQSEVSHSIVKAMQVNISQKESRSLAAKGTHKLKAYELYLKGKHAADDRSHKGLKKSVEQLQAAVEEDSSFADAYAQLAYSKLLQARYEFEDPDLSDLEAEKFAHKAIENDPENVLAHSVLGGIALSQGDFEKTEELMEKSLELGPNSPFPHHGLSQYYEATGDTEKELKHRKIAVELDPLLPVFQENYIKTLIKLDKMGEAKVRLAKVKELIPELEGPWEKLEELFDDMEEKRVEELDRMEEERVQREEAREERLEAERERREEEQKKREEEREQKEKDRRSEQERRRKYKRN